MHAPIQRAVETLADVVSAAVVLGLIPVTAMLIYLLQGDVRQRRRRQLTSLERRARERDVVYVEVQRTFLERERGRWSEPCQFLFEQSDEHPLLAELTLRTMQAPR